MAALHAFLRDLLDMGHHGHGEVPAAAAGLHRLDRHLRFYAAFYMMLAAAVLLNAVVPRASANDGTSYAAAVVGFSLWTAAVALLLLSFMHQRFPSTAAAAARLAQAALEASFRDLPAMDQHDEVPTAATGRHRPDGRLRFYAAFYMMVAAAVLLNAAVPRDSANAGISYAAAVVWFSLRTAAVALLLLSFMHQRIPSAAAATARLAQAPLEAFFRDLLVMDQYGEVPAAAAGRHRLDCRLHFYAAFYMMLAAAVLLNAVVPRDSANAGTSYTAAVVGFSLRTAAVALLLLSFMHQRFPSAAAAAARLAQAALEAFFRDLLVMDRHNEVPATAAGRHRLGRRLRFYAAFYMMLAAAVLLNAAVPRDSTNAGTSYTAAVVGFSLRTAAVALLLLSFMHQRFPSAAAAAARLARTALEAFLL